MISRPIYQLGSSNWYPWYLSLHRFPMDSFTLPYNTEVFSFFSKQFMGITWMIFLWLKSFIGIICSIILLRSSLQWGVTNIPQLRYLVLLSSKNSFKVRLRFIIQFGVFWPAKILTTYLYFKKTWMFLDTNPETPIFWIMIQAIVMLKENF